jgi:hypothetical protein
MHPISSFTRRVALQGIGKLAAVTAAGVVAPPLLVTSLHAGVEDALDFGLELIKYSNEVLGKVNKAIFGYDLVTGASNNKAALHDILGGISNLIEGQQKIRELLSNLRVDIRSEIADAFQADVMNELSAQRDDFSIWMAGGKPPVGSRMFQEKAERLDTLSLRIGKDYGVMSLPSYAAAIGLQIGSHAIAGTPIRLIALKVAAHVNVLDGWQNDPGEESLATKFRSLTAKLVLGDSFKSQGIRQINVAEIVSAEGNQIAISRAVVTIRVRPDGSRSVTSDVHEDVAIERPAVYRDAEGVGRDDYLSIAAGKAAFLGGRAPDEMKAQFEALRGSVIEMDLNDAKRQLEKTANDAALQIEDFFVDIGINEASDQKVLDGQGKYLTAISTLRKGLEAMMHPDFNRKI